MKPLFTLLCFLFSIHFSFGQKSIDNLIHAERNFAAYSVANSTKEAFLKFLDSNGVVFENGKAVNGIEAWNKRETQAGILNWYPLFAEISTSGDFGYTTGPWTFQQKTIQDSVVARGQYTTVWHLDKNGEWKFLVDLGSNNTPVNLKAEVKKISVPKLTINYITHVTRLIIAENDFQKMYAKNKLKAYKTFLSAESILNRNGILPAINSTDRKTIIDSTPPSIQYKLDGSVVSSAEDLGFVYGTTIINGKAENYLRIWRREKSGWKIGVEVLRY